jgi:hypothetical protein
MQGEEMCLKDRMKLRAGEKIEAFYGGPDAQARTNILSPSRANYALSVIWLTTFKQLPSNFQVYTQNTRLIDYHLLPQSGSFWNKVESWVPAGTYNGGSIATTLPSLQIKRLVQHWQSVVYR